MLVYQRVMGRPWEYHQQSPTHVTIGGSSPRKCGFGLCVPGSSYIKFHGTNGWWSSHFMGIQTSWVSKSPQKRIDDRFLGKRTRLHGRRFRGLRKACQNHLVAGSPKPHLTWMPFVNQKQKWPILVHCPPSDWGGHPPIFHTQITMADKPNSWVAYIPFTAQDSQKASISWWLHYLWLKYFSIL